MCEPLLGLLTRGDERLRSAPDSVSGATPRVEGSASEM